MVSKKPRFIIGGILSGLLGLWVLVSATDFALVAINGKSVHFKAGEVRSLESVMFWSAVIPLALIGVMVWRFRVKTAAWEKQQTVSQAQAEKDNDYIAELEAQGPRPVDVSGIVLQAGEVAYYQSQATAYVPKATTRRVGGYGGLSVPTGIKGVRANFGRIASTPVSSTHFESEGIGTLTVTNKRIIFIGNFGSKSTSLSNLLNVVPYQDGARLEIDNGKPAVYATGDIRLAATLLAVTQHESTRQTTGLTSPKD